MYLFLHLVSLIIILNHAHTRRVFLFLFLCTRLFWSTHKTNRHRYFSHFFFLYLVFFFTLHGWWFVIILVQIQFNTIEYFIVAKATARTVTPPTARVPPTAASKPGVNKGSTENNSHSNSALGAQVEDMSNQVNSYFSFRFRWVFTIDWPWPRFCFDFR